MEQLNSYVEFITKMVLEFAPKLILAILVLFIGLRIIRKVAVWANAAMKRSGVGEDVRPFLTSILSFLLKIMLIFSVAGIVGIETASFVAVLAAAGFTVGMALQGSLSNFAAGILILIFRPYKLNDLIQVESKVGHVREIQMLNTVIATLQNETVIIPNAMAISGIITNLSARQYLRVDLKIMIPYEENFETVREVILDALKNTPKVLDTPEPFVGIEAFESHNVVVAMRPYAHTEDYWDVHFEANRRVKRALSEHGIRVAYAEGLELGKIGL